MKLWVKHVETVNPGINVIVVNKIDAEIRVDPISVTKLTKDQLSNTRVVQSQTNYKTTVYI